MKKGVPSGDHRSTDCAESNTGCVHVPPCVYRDIDSCHRWATVLGSDRSTVLWCCLWYTVGTDLSIGVNVMNILGDASHKGLWAIIGIVVLLFIMVMDFPVFVVAVQGVATGVQLQSWAGSLEDD